MFIFVTFDSALPEFYYHFESTERGGGGLGIERKLLKFLTLFFFFGTHSEKNKKIHKKYNISAFLHILNPSRILMNPAFSLKKIEGHSQLTDLQRVTHILQLQEYAVTIFSPSLSFEVEKVEGIDLIRHHFKRKVNACKTGEDLKATSIESLFGTLKVCVLREKWELRSSCYEVSSVGEN